MIKNLFRNLPALLLLSPFLLFSQSCSKEKKAEKLCSSGALTYNDGDKFLNIPTAFTPNSDGVNDQFRPVTNISPDSFSFRVIRPDGITIFQSTADNYSWEITDASLKDIYEYYVETTIIENTTEGFTACSPLFILSGPYGECITNAKKEDLDRYRFEDQYTIGKGFVLATNECIKL